MLGNLSLQTWFIVVGILIWGAVQYGLACWTLRDLARRPRVRGDNKIIWALIILIVPLGGALLYATMGPTSFLPRSPRRQVAPAATRERPPANGPAADA